MPLLAARLVDFAIFGTLGSLWIVGAGVIFFVWRWVIRNERQGGDAPRRPIVAHVKHAATQVAVGTLARE